VTTEAVREMVDAMVIEQWSRDVAPTARERRKLIRECLDKIKDEVVSDGGADAPGEKAKATDPVVVIESADEEADKTPAAAAAKPKSDHRQRLLAPVAPGRTLNVARTVDRDL
jgi:hypothetical protein